jgi:hypothetical protein
MGTFRMVGGSVAEPSKKHCMIHDMCLVMNFIIRHLSLKVKGHAPAGFPMS